MNILKRIFSGCLLSALLVSSVLIFASCKSSQNDKEGDESNETLNVTDYTVVRSDTAINKVSKMTSLLKKKILSDTGAELSVITDYEAETEYEILVGETNRKESTEALEELKKSYSKNAYIVKVTEKKIAIVGISNDDTVIGVKRFINEIVAASNGEKTLPISNGYTDSKKTGDLLYVSDDNALIVREELSTVYQPSTFSTEFCTYGKIIKLEHSGENNGTLISTKENGAYGSTAADYRYPIFKSTDDGATWEEIARVDDGYNVGAVVGYQPYLYELPTDIGNFKAGTILLAFCSRYGTNNDTRIVLSYSTDVGETWTTLYNISEGGSFNDGDWSSEGLWEPFLIYEEETKRLYCFYSDELSTEHNQRLVYKYTTDLKNWSDVYECMAAEDPDLRPGMVSIAKMGNGKYALVYEVCGGGYGAKIHIKFADRLDNWDVDDLGTQVRSSTSAGLYSAPAIAWTPDGGECGTLFLTAAGSIDLNNNSINTCYLFVSFDYGETFISFDNPIDISQKNDHNQYEGYSSGFFVSKEGTLYYVNNPQFTFLSGQLQFARIKVY